jgi:hypothetical protein
MNKPIVVEVFADNGEHSHWELIDDNGDVLWDSWEVPFDYKKALERYENNLKNSQKELDILIEKYKLKNLK